MLRKIINTVAVALGLCLPAGLLAWLYLGEWVHAVGGLVLALTGLIIGTQHQGPPWPPWPRREDL